MTGIGFDPQTFEAVVTMHISSQYNQLPADTSASIFTAGLLGEQYVGLEPGGEMEVLKDGSEIVLTQSALILEQLIGQFLFSKASEGEQNDVAEVVGCQRGRGIDIAGAPLHAAERLSNSLSIPRPRSWSVLKRIGRRCRPIQNSSTRWWKTWCCRTSISSVCRSGCWVKLAQGRQATTTAVRR